MHYRGRGGRIIGITKKDLDCIVKENMIVTDKKQIQDYRPVFLGKRIYRTRISKEHYIIIKTNTRGENQLIAVWEKRVYQKRPYWVFIGDNTSGSNP